MAKFDKDKQLKHLNIEEFYVKMDMVDDKMFYKNMQLIWNIKKENLKSNNMMFHFQTKKNIINLLKKKAMKIKSYFLVEEITFYLI